MARMQVLIFEIDGRKFGIDANLTSGILRGKKYTIQKLPTTSGSISGSIEGMINLRGKISYIFNLRKKFKMDHVANDEESKIIMVYINELSVGCIVDEVTDIIMFDSDEFEQVPLLIREKEKQYITGIGKVQDELIIMLNLSALLIDDEIEGLCFEQLDA